jgi:undecaprenyl diphosphate synthase
MSRLSPKLQKLCAETMERSKDFTRVQVNFCINYGGRDEIIRAARAFAADVAAGKHTADSLTEAEFEHYLDSAGVPDPEIVIRPSGEQRISNFLPWQSAYSEFVFLDVLWPDFSDADLDRAIEEFNRRNRRFGGV